MRNHLLFCIIFVTSLIMLPDIRAHARVFQGQQGDQTFRLETRLIEEVEYVRAVDVLPHFQGEWEYDSLSGTLAFLPPNGERIGIKANQTRFLIGNKVYQHTTAPPIRRDQHFYIPFYFAMTYLFPQIELREIDARDTPTPPSQQTPTITPTQARYVFQQPTKTQATPTQKPLIFDQPSPTPTSPWITTEPTPEPLQPMEQKVVILDPGNDPSNPGAGLIQELREYELTMLICEKLAEYLRNTQNFEVLLTRGRDAKQPVSNTQRIALANKNQGNIFVSIQCGALFTPDMSLGGVFFMNPVLDHSLPTQATPTTTEQAQLWHDSYKKHISVSHLLSQMLHKKLQECYRVQNIISMESNPRPGRFAILRGLTMPGVVVELGNLAHPMTASYLASERIQDDIAFHLGQGITDYLYGETLGSN